ncbi:Tetracycline resistance protein, class C [Rubripirellula obstinata]|uniref:Tetracycline resistance protein, class C n=1 Tax=Rubripirellula obstinata TaxID=406547 RepID=A0A5B1CHX8_9BACT|nr:TCR/Tet family MFS transporter [Rubripirellula obstinata]KAA1259545.1 Tetracycline resistance protein, class C [Rubripirellula obstinata]
MNSADRTPRKAAIAFILFTLFIDILGIGIVIPVLPELVKELVDQPVVTELPAEGLVSGGLVSGGLPVGGLAVAGNAVPASESVVFSRAGRYVGVIGATYALMQFLCAPIMGALSDRFGRRPVLLVSLFGLGVDFLIQGFAPNIWWLFIGRTLAGVMGASLTTGNAYIADISTDETRARNFGLVGAMFGLGFTIGPALGGILGDYSLRLPFFVAAGLALVNWLYGYFVLPESLAPENRTAFTLKGANPFRVIGRLKVYPLVAALAAVLVLKSLAQRGLENVWVLYTGFKFEWDAGTNGLALGLVGVMAIVVQGGLVRPVIKRIGERKAVVFGTIISAIAFACYGLASQPWMIPGIIVFGSLGGIAGPAIQSLVTGSVDETEQGKVQGALTGLTSLTNVIAPIFFNFFLFSYFVSDAAPIVLPGAPLLAGSLLLTVSIFIAIRVFRRFPAATTGTSSAAVSTDEDSN